MKVYIKKRWIKKCIKANKYYCIPDRYFLAFGGKVFDAKKSRRIVCLLPYDTNGWCLPFAKVKLVSR